MMIYASPSSDSEESIDKRIVKLEYRNYDLVSRFWEFGYLGKIWKNRRPVEEIDAVDDEGIDELVVRMKARVDEIIAEKCRARDNRAPNHKELAEGFQQVYPKLSELECVVLKTHATGRDGVIALERLQKATGYNSAAAILMTYSSICQRLCDEIGYQPKETPGPYPALTLMLRQVPKTPQSLTMKKEPLKAVRAIEW